MKDLAKIRHAWTIRAARFAFIAWTLVQPAAAQQFQPVPPPAAGSALRPAASMSGQQPHSELRKGLSQGWPRSALWPERDEC
jgi:hypothetical protein